MDISKLEPRRPWEQVHPSRDPTELERIGGVAGLTHVGAIVADVVMPIVARHELEQALRDPAIVIEFRTQAAELVV
jgi:hypothetical protein